MSIQDLRETRLRLGLTQEDLAAKARVSDRTVKRAEAGMPTRPSTVKAIEGALEREASIRVLAERMAGTDGFALPRPLTANIDAGHRVEPFETRRGGRAWRVVSAMAPTTAYDAGLRPHDIATSPEAHWAFHNLADALVALVLLDHDAQRLEAGIAREWGYGAEVAYLRLPRFVHVDSVEGGSTR